MPRVLLIGMRGNTLKSRRNEHLYNEVLGIKNYFLYLCNSKMYVCMKKNHDITKPLYGEHNLLVPWRFLISRFHCVIPGTTSGERIMRSMFATLSHIY